MAEQASLANLGTVPTPGADPKRKRKKRRRKARYKEKDEMTTSTAKKIAKMHEARGVDDDELVNLIQSAGSIGDLLGAVAAVMDGWGNDIKREAEDREDQQEAREWLAASKKVMRLSKETMDLSV